MAVFLALILGAAAASPSTSITIPVAGDIETVRFTSLSGSRYMQVVYTAAEPVKPSKDALVQTISIGRRYTELYLDTPSGWALLATDYALAAPVSDQSDFGEVHDGRAAPTTAELATELYPVGVVGPRRDAAFVYGFLYYGGPRWIQHGSLTVVVATISAAGGLEVSWHGDIDVRGAIQSVYTVNSEIQIVTESKGPADPECCPSKFLNLWLKWDGKRFVESRRCLSDSANSSC